MTAALKRFGRIDGLVNIAGIADPHVAPLSELSLADWNRYPATNLTGAFLCCKHAMPELKTSWRHREHRIHAHASIGAGYRGLCSEQGWTRSTHPRTRRKRGTERAREHDSSWLDPDRCMAQTIGAKRAITQPARPRPTPGRPRGHTGRHRRAGRLSALRASGFHHRSVVCRRWWHDGKDAVRLTRSYGRSDICIHACAARCSARLGVCDVQQLLPRARKKRPSFPERFIQPDPRRCTRSRLATQANTADRLHFYDDFSEAKEKGA